MPEKHYRNCNLCEAICGIEIAHEDGKILSIAGDKLDPFSRGHICPKALALKEIYEDGDRLRMPVRRTEGGWQEIGWDEAFDETASRIADVQAKYGRDAVAVYQGNPSVHNLGTMLNGRELLKALKTKNNYSATSVDQLPHHFASWAMFGHHFLIPIPDIDRTDHFLILGANPLASNGSLMTSPDIINRLEAIRKRGGKIVVIDPRRTETTRVADEHFFIRPGSDAYLFLAMANTLFAEGLADPGRLTEFTDGIETLRSVSTEFTPEIAERVTGIPEVEIRRLTREFAAAKSAVCYGRIGLSTQKFGGLCQWLINAINILTGNFDRSGGAMFTSPAFDLLMTSKGGNVHNRWQSRVRGLPEFMGELPAAALAEEIETDGEGQIKALITSCGNPVLSTPNGGRLERALPKLEFIVSIDIYINETTRHADIILPPATNLESSHYDVIFNTLAVRNTAKYSPPLFAKAENARCDWEIFQELVWRLNGTNGQFKPEPPEVKLDLALRFGKSDLTIEELKTRPHGVDLGELKQCLPERLMTADKKINIAPDILIDDLERLKAERRRIEDTAFPFSLIGRRHLRDCNSWMHNSPVLMKGKNRCTLMMNTADAVRLNLAGGEIVRVTSRVGSVELPVEVSENLGVGVVSIPHGYGHAREGVRLRLASSHAGVSINDLTDETVLDDLTGNAAFSGVRVRVEKVD
ncbi:MAG TPA: molybdopterin oxidoreductase family protein [Pyrinomonadaceae bacterium]|nr:molybdopterin oxidoreductase family protein [Pyrinomonadaceae bacterium]